MFITNCIVRLYTYQLSSDEELNAIMEQDYYIQNHEAENELPPDDDSFDDTFSRSPMKLSLMRWTMKTSMSY